MILETDIYKQGVYAIINMVNGKAYYGSTTCSFRNRWRQHKNELNKGTHCNKHLQGAWHKYGSIAFEFKIIMICDNDSCLSQEQLLLDEHFDGGINCYNICPIAGSFMIGRKHTTETKNKMSAAKKGKPGANKGLPSQLKGRTLKQGAIEKIMGSNNGRAKLKPADVIVIRALRQDGWPELRIAKKFNVGRSTISHICRRDTWPDL